MNKETNNEIDLLLRRMSRRDGGSVRGANGADDRHLDADELSAYAENALPAAARARYTEHLADCATCRRLATELSLAIGATTAARVETVPEPSGWKKFLASLFTPLVLRYAVPALGMVIVAAIGFVVLRQRSRQEFVARVNTEAGAPAATSPAPAMTESDKPSVNHIDSLEQKTETAQGSVTKPAEPKPAREKPEKGAATTDTVSGAAQPLATADRAVTDPQPGVAASPTPPAASKAAAAETEAQKKAEDAPKPATATQSVVVQNEQAKILDDSRRGSEGAANQKEQDKTKESPSANSGFTIQGMRGIARSRPGSTAAKRAEEPKRDQETNEQSNEAAKDEAETRSVAGRQFRRTRGIWIDTAYDSSTATVNMARSSEQFRALVADEPAIGTIAKQLDGEVIVVWKGRAYRIR